MSFFDMFGPMFDPESGPNRSQGQRANKSGNDDPIILNVETDGDNTARSSANMPPRGPSGPRITRQPNRPRKSSNGNKILIGVVLALAIIIGLFFGLAQFITDVMWYAQLGFQSVIWTQLGTRVGLWVAYALLIAAVGFLSASLAIWARPDAAMVPRFVLTATPSKWARRELKECTSCGCGDFIDRRLDVRIAV